ncbi:MAG TPA: hypothetical protein VLZ05_08990 [Mycobacterium sp.]|nr:hypothetical protein [Mycobacterium sp.]HUH68998.1 hypothetical protein [Mycobacterium sp.]
MTSTVPAVVAWPVITLMAILLAARFRWCRTNLYETYFTNLMAFIMLVETRLCSHRTVHPVGPRSDASMTAYGQPYPRFGFTVIGDLSTIDFNKPVQKVTAELRRLGSGMIEQPIGQPVIFLAETALIDEVNDDTRWEKHIGPSLRRLRSISVTAYSLPTTTNRIGVRRTTS